MKQIQSFMSEIPDEFKIVVVRAIQGLCFKFPKKHDVMMSMLSTMLRDEPPSINRPSVNTPTMIFLVFTPDTISLQGGYTYKEAIVNTIIAVIEANPGSQVRAAAVTSLAKFGAVCQDLRPSILVLLRRCMYDSHDEVTANSKTDDMDTGPRKPAVPQKTRQEELAEQLAQIPEDQQLENVKVEVEGELYNVLGYIACPMLCYNKPGTSYTLLELPEDPSDVSITPYMGITTP
eukprot:sb/3469366/